jgi:hypothetical protein
MTTNGLSCGVVFVIQDVPQTATKFQKIILSELRQRKLSCCLKHYILTD